MLALWSWISSLLDCEKSISIVYKLPILWYFSYSPNWKEWKEKKQQQRQGGGGRSHSFPYCRSSSLFQSWFYWTQIWPPAPQKMLTERKVSVERKDALIRKASNLHRRCPESSSKDSAQQWQFLRCWLKRCTMWAFLVKFSLGKNEDGSPEDSASDSSERLLQKGSGERSTYKILMKGEFNAIKHLLYKRFSVSHMELMSPRRDLMLF